MAWKQVDSWGQAQLLRDQSSGLPEQAEVKRETMVARVAFAKDLIFCRPTLTLDEVPKRSHWIIWHELEDERRLLEKAIPGIRTAYGSQDLDEREEIILGFAHGAIEILGTKPSIAGSGTNLQRHCADAIFLGSTYKFNDFIQAVHRIYRFQQSREVHIHVIYSEAEEPVVNALKQKWEQHNTLVAKMTNLIRKYGLSLNPIQLVRGMGVEREEVSGEFYRAIFNDCIPEVDSWPENCVDEIVTSIPFGNQYEYSPNFCDLGHNPDNEGFFRQMDFLVPNLLRVLKPGRIACIHVKDRIRFGNVTGRGTPTVDRFSDKTADLFERHGFWFMGRITIDTDVVRENNQTYRLGWSEVCKDGTKMGVGMPEYVLILRKPPTDCSNSYADEPVTKEKADYGRSDWQVDAEALWKSSGVTLPDLETLKQMPITEASRAWRAFSAAAPYCHTCHVQAAKALESNGTLPAKFMLFPPIARHPDIWTDIVRMRVLNSKLDQRNRENHICPLQVDVVERLINRYSNPGDVVFDPFAGIFTVPYVAIGLGRIGWGTELARNYWKNGVDFCQEAEAKRVRPEMDLFANFSASEPEMAEAK
jgi:DNA modification methylase